MRYTLSKMINVQLVCFCGPLTPCRILGFFLRSVAYKRETPRINTRPILPSLSLPPSSFLLLCTLLRFFSHGFLSLSLPAVPLFGMSVLASDLFSFVYFSFLVFCLTLIIRLKVLLSLLMLVGLFFPLCTAFSVFFLRVVICTCQTGTRQKIERE